VRPGGDGLAVSVKALAPEAPGGIMAPCGKFQQTRYGLWL